MKSIASPDNNKKLYSWAIALAVVTILYNIVEGLISVFFGFEDGSMSLFGFGLDSFVEVLSGIGIWHMISRIRKQDNEHLDRFERTALRVTGTGFYLLAVGLVATSAADLYLGHKPQGSSWGIGVAIVSILSMWLLVRAKVRVGSGLHSSAILADAACSRACLQLSVVLLLASVGYRLTAIGGLDSVGALLIGGLCFREGSEAFEKSKKGSLVCTCGGSCKTEGGIAFPR